MSKIVAAIGMGVLILATAVVIGPTITDLSTDDSTTAYVGVNESVELNSDLQASVTGVNTSQPKNSTVELYDRKTRERVAQTINESTRTQILIRGEQINMTAQNISDSGTVRLKSEYPPTYGQRQAVKTATNQLPLILATVGFVLVIGATGRVMFA